MDKEKVVLIFKVLKTTYPAFYKDISKEEMEDTINLWTSMFQECNSVLVMQAVKELINTSKFPPTIADIKEKMYELKNQGTEKTPSELWECLSKAICNSAYNSEKEFENLPDEVKKFVRTPNQLFELSQMNSSTINSVTKGQFLKQIEVIKERKKKDELMLPETRQMLGSLTQKFLKEGD